MLPVGSLVHFNQRLWWVLTLASFRGCLCIVSWSRNLKIVYEFRLHYWYTSSELQWSFGSSQAEVIAFQLMLSTSALVSSVQKKNSSKIGMMLWPPESQLSLNANLQPVRLAVSYRCWFVYVREKYCWLVQVNSTYVRGLTSSSQPSDHAACSCQTFLLGLWI